MNTTVVLADDHPVVRQGLLALFSDVPELRVIGEASDGLEAVALVQRLEPNVLVADVMMPGLNGLEVARRISLQSPRTRVVMLSMYANEAYVVEALRNGAAGYVLKDAPGAALVEAVRAVAGGGHYLSPPLSERAVAEYVARAAAATLDLYDTLTPREREVLQLAAEGFSSTEIAARLCISPRTAEAHRSHAMQKLGIRNQTDLVRYALRRGIVAMD
jgi:DNA-binding NarL/FixJ family response regulator